MQDSIDILALQEPFVFNNRVPFSLSSRVFHSHPFNDTIYSAIVVINNSLIIQHLHDFTNFFASSILIQTRSKYLVFVNVYIHPGTFCDTHCNFFDSLLSSYPNCPIILCGDFNARNPYWYDSVTNSNGYRLKNVIDSHNLIILNNKSKTCRQASIIDLTITNSMAYSYIYNWHVTRFTELSDHETIKFDIVSSHDNFENHHIKSTWKFIEENMECYNNNIDQHSISELNQFINDCSNHSDLNVATNKLAKIYIEAAYKSFNVRKPSNYPKKFTWWTKSLDNQKRYFQYIKNLYYRNNSQISYDFYKNVRNNYYCRVLLLYANADDAEIIFDEIRKQGMDQSGYVWIVSEQASKASNRFDGILSLRLESSDEQLMIEDSINILTNALLDMYYRHNITVPPTNCRLTSSNKWQTGQLFYDYLKKWQ